MQLHFGGGGTFDENVLFHSLYSNNKFLEEQPGYFLIMFFNIMASLKISFFSIMDSIYI